MGGKYTQQDAEKAFKDVGLTLLDNYTSFEKKMVCVDEEGYRFNYNLHYIKRMSNKNISPKHRFSHNNPHYWDNILLFMEKNVNNGTKILTTKERYESPKQKMLFMCGECGRQYRQTFDVFIRRAMFVCPDCSCSEKGKRARVNPSIYKDKLKELGYEILSPKEFDTRTKLTVVDKDGYKGCINAKDLLYNNTKISRYSKSNPYTMYNIKNFIKINNIDCLVEDKEYDGINTMFEFTCKCGRKFKRTWNHFCYNSDFYCNVCKSDVSTLEALVKAWLVDNNIKFEREYVFNGCDGDYKPLRFDFYLPDFNACIEVDGIQHFKPVGFSGAKTKEDNLKLFEKHKKYDGIKNDYCKTHNIPLLRMGYWEFRQNSLTYTTTLNDFILSIQK